MPRARSGQLPWCTQLGSRTGRGTAGTCGLVGVGVVRLLVDERPVAVGEAADVAIAVIEVVIGRAGCALVKRLGGPASREGGSHPRWRGQRDRSRSGVGLTGGQGIGLEAPAATEGVSQWPGGPGPGRLSAEKVCRLNRLPRSNGLLPGARLVATLYFL